MEKINKEKILRIANLAKLELSEQEISEQYKDLNKILEYMDQLNEVNTDNVEPLSHPIPIQNVFREDEHIPSISKEEALKNSPDNDENYFSVPKVI